MRRFILGILLVLIPSKIACSMVPPSFPSPCIRTDVNAIIYDMASLYKVDPILLTAVIDTESSWEQSVRSYKGAIGLTQVMPSTAKELNIVHVTCTVPNIAAGAKYIAQLEGIFHSRSLVIAAYNAGPGAVKRANGVPRVKETRNYVARVIKTYNKLVDFNRSASVTQVVE